MNTIDISDNDGAVKRTKAEQEAIKKKLQTLIKAELGTDRFLLLTYNGKTSETLSIGHIEGNDISKLLAIFEKTLRELLKAAKEEARLKGYSVEESVQEELEDLLNQL